MLNIQNLKLNFHLNSSITVTLKANNERIDSLTKILNEKIKNVGKNNSKYRNAEDKVKNAIEKNTPLEQVITQKIDIRALAFLLSDYSYSKETIDLSDKLLLKIKSIRPQLTQTIIKRFTTYFFKKFDLIPNYKNLSKWIIDTVKERNKSDLSKNRSPMDFIDLKFLSPHKSIEFLITTAIYNKKALDDVIKQTKGLYHYVTNNSRYMQKVQSIYYISQLENIPANKEHKIIDEILESKVYNNVHENNALLGSKILEILISKAPNTDVNEQWQNAVLEIAGDPRVGSTNPKYRKWWQYLDSNLRNKVIGWLSKLDLKLFLDAMGSYAENANDPDLKRMFPKRKMFLQGLLKEKLILKTRLYLSKNMSDYLQYKAGYKKEHLPAFSNIYDGDKSVIHISLPNNVDVTEGTHNCYMSFYSNLSDKAIIFNYDKRNVSYNDLNSGLRKKFKENFHDKVTHSGDWWSKSLNYLYELGVKIDPHEIMEEDDYKEHKRIHGVRTWR